MLNCLGLYPGEAGDPGTDYAGTVLRVGAGVTNVRAGDAVIGFAEGSFGTVVRAPAAAAAPLPAPLAAAAGATAPTVYMTADAVLNAAARVGAGDLVLVHTLSGGVGVAALHLLRALRADVLGTAGSAAKRALLRSQGVAHVLGSRCHRFADELAQLGGASAVINTLTSPGELYGTDFGPAGVSA